VKRANSSGGSYREIRHVAGERAREGARTIDRQRRMTIEALAEGKAADTQVELLLKIQSGIDVLDTLMADDEDEEDEE
jgi:hypothetical protein